MASKTTQRVGTKMTLEEAKERKAKQDEAIAQAKKPPTRVSGKQSQKEANKSEEQKFWEDFAIETSQHAAKSEKAAKIIRDTVITRKAAGRIKPKDVEYQLTVVEKSKVPIKGAKSTT
jgi:hypothetical protein